MGFRCVDIVSEQQPSSNGDTGAVVCVGDIIPTDAEEGFLRGHGTLLANGELVSTVCGVVQRVNKLVSVAPLSGRYNAQLGDVVVGRVAEIVAQRWKLDICAQQDAVLQLSAVNLPGSAQRRRTIEDELNMRSVFSEGDLITAEVQSLFTDHSVALHTRSAKYGQVARGQLTKVPAGLLRRRKQQVVRLEDHGVSMTLGLNGYVFISPDSPAQQSSASKPPAEQHDDVAQAAAAVRVLVALEASVDANAVSAVIRAAADAHIAPDNMLDSASLHTLSLSVNSAVS